MKEVYSRLRMVINDGIDAAGVTIREEGDEKVPPGSSKDEEKKGDGLNAPDDTEEDKRKKENITPKKAVLFVEPITLSEMGDRDEGGTYRVGGANIMEDGPKSIIELEEMISSAVMQHGGSKTSCRIWDAKPDPVDGKGWYERIRTGYEDGQMVIIPNTGSSFLRFEINDDVGQGKSFGVREFIRMSQNEEEVGRRLNKILRHNIGAREVTNKQGRKHQGVPCDFEARVPLMDVLEYEHIWEPVSEGRRFNRNNQTKANSDEAFARYNLLVAIGCYERRRTKKLRYQILALGVEKNVTKLDSKICQDYGIDAEVFKTHGNEVMIKPLAVRATSGWSYPREPHVARDTLSISLPFTVQCKITVRGCWHLFAFGDLASIVKDGLIPGGLDSGRIQTFFNPFAPWDPRNRRILRTTGVGARIPAVIYVKTEKMEDFGIRLTQSGHIVTERTIPFEAFDGMWYMADEKGDEDWIRLLNRDTRTMVVNRTYSSRYQAKVSKIARFADEILKSDARLWPTAQFNTDDIRECLKIDSIYDPKNEQCMSIRNSCLITTSPGKQDIVCALHVWKKSTFDLTTCHYCWGVLIAVGEEIPNDDEKVIDVDDQDDVEMVTEDKPQMNEGDKADIQKEEELEKAAKAYDEVEAKSKEVKEEDVDMKEAGEQDAKDDDEVPDWGAEEDDVPMPQADDDDQNEDPVDEDEARKFAEEVKKIPKWCQYPSRGCELMTREESELRRRK